MNTSVGLEGDKCKNLAVEKEEGHSVDFYTSPLPLRLDARCRERLPPYWSGSSSLLHHNSSPLQFGKVCVFTPLAPAVVFSICISALCSQAASKSALRRQLGRGAVKKCFLKVCFAKSS